MIWLKLAQALIPTLVGKLTSGRGKVAQDVAQIALEATGLSADTPPDDVLKALDADPAVLARVREAAIEVALAELQAEVASEQIAAADRASARAMQEATDARAPLVIAGFVMLGLFAIVGALIFVPIPGGSKEVIMAVVGALTTAMIGIINFYFGSSQSSKDKTAAILRMK
ncbi:hypothetical protein J7426_14265 [Tropicibacter sp. R16_0]|uniref:hypothetical protein n=1 Tax=Tropicibacter sp. R16_0 TaxID=2821102 RepID=UPI001ADBBDC9|nr:hypothetical protein [Tropicibacter sp. R16_0]MBO9451434.1 hypothetical protein [Tropicibacter sp. R16_0]